MRRIRDYFREHEDVCINFHKTRPIMATMNFSTPYIKAFARPQREKDKVLVFSWTENKYRQVEPKTIKSLFPLSQVLQNEPISE